MIRAFRKLGLAYTMIAVGFLYGCLITNAAWIAPGLAHSLIGMVR